MAKPKVLLLGSIDYAHETWKALSEVADIIEPKSKNRQEFFEECKTDLFRDIVACYRTYECVSMTGPWDEELVNALPAGLKSVHHNAAGYDQLHIPAFTPLRILVTNVPTAVDDATADTGIFLMLGALRNFYSFIHSTKANQWRGGPPAALGHDPQGKTVGIIGMGGIGRNFAKKCRAFGMNVQYCNRKRLSDPAMEDGARYVGFEELLRTSDVVSLNLPLNRHTRHTLGREELAKCKKGAVIVNTARGGVIDEAALVEALESGHISAVGLDVFENEPSIHPGLLKNDRAFLLPHAGTHTIETMIKMEEWCIGNVRKSLEWRVFGNKDSGRGMSVVAEQRDLFEELLAES